MRQQIKWLMIGMLLLLLAACGKSTERQIAEQLELGQKYLTEGNYDQAIVAYNKAIEIEPKNEQAYTELAAVLLELGRYDEAIEILERASQEIPDSEAIRAQLEYQFPSVTASLEPGTYDERETLELKNENQFDIYYRIAGSEIAEDTLYETAIDLGANGTYEIIYYAVNPDDRKGRQYSEVYTIELDPQKYTMNDWLQENGEWYYYDADGYPVTGWQEIDEQWYYFYEDGSMAHDVWIEDYYLGSDGAMLIDAVTPDGYTVGADGKWTGYTESQLLALIEEKAIGTLSTYITADFNGDGKIEAVAVMVDTGGRERDCTAYRWYTDGQSTYCYEQKDYWWLKEDTFYLITTEDGIHLGETIVARNAADWCDSSVYKFDENGYERLFFEENIYIMESGADQVACEERYATDALYGSLILNTIQKGKLVYNDGTYSCDWF